MSRSYYGYDSDSGYDSNSSSESVKIDYGGFRSAFSIRWNAFRSALRTITAAYNHSKTLSQADILTNLTSLANSAGQWQLHDDAQGDSWGAKEASRCRSSTARKWRRRNQKYYDQMLKMDEEGWPGWLPEEKEFAQSAWKTEPMSLVQLAWSIKSGDTLSTLSKVTTTKTTPKKVRKRRRTIVDLPATTKSTVIEKTTPTTTTTDVVEKTTPAGTTATATVTETATTETKTSDKEEKKT